jgi:hypothetical protein
MDKAEETKRGQRVNYYRISLCSPLLQTDGMGRKPAYGLALSANMKLFYRQSQLAVLCLIPEQDEKQRT